MTDSLGREERYHFVGEGPGQRWVAHTRADGSRIEYRYDRAGQHIATIDPLGRETRLERDDAGRIVAKKNPGDERWAIKRDELGQPIGMDGPEGLNWTIERDVRGNPVSVTGPAGTTRYEYERPDLPDRPTTITDPGDATRVLTWNALGQLLTESDCSNQQTTYGYDANDHLHTVTNALNETHEFEHDLMGRRLTTRLPDNTIWQQHYDAQGRLAAQKDPLGGQQRVIYDAAGRAIAQIEADGSQQRVTYDAAGRISALTLGNGATYHFTYDVMDRVIQEVSPDGRDQRFEYDAAGQQIARTEMNRPGPDGQPLVTRYVFDTNGRLIERWLPATVHASECCEVYGWRADGQLASADNAYGEVLFTYDETGRVAGEQQRHYDTPGTTAAEAWQWQTRHRFTETGAPAASQFGGLPEFTWLTYGSGHLLGVNAPDLDLEVAFKPDALHRETLRRFSLADHGTALEGKTPQPLVLERGYTPAGQITHLTLQGSEIDSPHQQFDYDALGRMSTRQLKSRPENRGNRSDGLVIDYSFDAAGRLTGSRHGDEQQHYPMDAAGNRLDNRHARTDATLSNNRIQHLYGTNYRYDGAGNLIERQRADGERLDMGYDGANRLVHLVRTDARGETTEVAYRYDPLGRRITKIIDAPGRTRFTTHYGWDGDRLVHEDSPAQPATTVVYEPGSFIPMLRLDEDGGEILSSAYVTDALGTPMQLVALDGTVHWQARPHDWAAVQDERGTTSQSIRFQGQWQDEESGLYYNRHRYYDPQAGRYITQDPIGLRGGVNLYGYVDNPTGMVDPLGLSPWESIKYHAQMIPKFMYDEGIDVLGRTATVMGGAGQIMLGAGLCSTGLGASIGVPLATLGASNIQEGFSEDGSGFARDAAVQMLGNSWGNAAIDGLNLGSSAGGLTRSVLKPDSFKIFRNIRADYEPAFRQSTQVGLSAEAFSSGMGLYGGIEKQIQVNGAQNE